MQRLCLVDDVGPEEPDNTLRRESLKNNQRLTVRNQTSGTQDFKNQTLDRKVTCWKFNERPSSIVTHSESRTREQADVNCNKLTVTEFSQYALDKTCL